MEKVTVGAKVKLIGLTKWAERFALLDTGASFTIVDESLAEEIGVEPLPQEFRAVTMSALCCKVNGALANIKGLIIEDRHIGSTAVLSLNLPGYVKEALRSHALSDDVIIGVNDLAKTGYVIDPAERKLKYAGILAV